MSDIASIENLIDPDTAKDEDSVQGKFAKKQQEIKLKEIEKQTEQNAAAIGLPYVNLFGFPISPEALVLIPEERSRELKAVCFFYDGKNIRVACLEPNEEIALEIQRLNEQYFADTKLYLISQNSLNQALEAYKAVPKVKKYDSGVEISEESLEKFKQDIASYKNLNEKINEVNVSDIVTLLLATAIKVGSSDIHIEAEENGVIIRFRIDGVLQEAAVIDKEKWKKIITRMKILAKVKINISNKPQDGRYTIYLKDGKIDVRSSFLPTAYGESVVMRLLNSKAVALEFESLGIRPEILEKLKQEISKPNGLILTTGPTGSGKTTTLYAILNILNQPGTKIVTLEDPVEYQLAGINQSQVDASKGYTFSDGLRSILRQDPNVIMVGEIRDLETAEIAIQASLTGHLVLSTLHTNDAAGVIPRLIDIGVKPYLLVPSINAVISQRLVRKLCPYCRQEHRLSTEEEEKVQKILAVISPRAKVNTPSKLPTIYKAGAGCEQCNYLGYKGRIGIYETFTMDDNLKQLTIDKAPSFKILQQAIENGMITMLQDGVLKVMDGITSLEEVYRVIGNFNYVDELYDIVISQTIGRGVKITAAEYERGQALTKHIGQAINLSDIPSKELIKMIMSMASASDAGDVHIEPEENGVAVRFRIDGVMHDILDLPKTSYLPILSEVKILAGFATNIKRATLDGRFSVYLPEKKFDCRLSIISGGYGETIVIRLLINSAASLDLEKLGITSVAKKELDKAITKTKGIIIATGPTGSGKTTTLYGILNKLNKSDVKIITIEDPIEYQLPGIMQTQIDTERGYTFAAAMRSLLRQNPNIMMIGEIRDEETAKIAIEAAMTGHLVLSTIHANSAAGAISRFAGLGVDKSSLANAIEFSIGQRLARRICPHCKIEDTPGQEMIEQAKSILSSIKNKEVVIPKTLKFYKGAGCEQCNHLGYKGRVGLYETIPSSNSIRKLIQKEETTDYDIEQEAINEGTISIAQDGVLKALAGETSLEEVFRVI
ncbi:MAG: Type II secretion system protein E [Parcubacteria group bacterium ADurb.Bin115]|nr:MAG: Type II secretion system protein E [Parcubacteria group bacterium ADurb.Bin115]HOD87300.1 GspE/PulE family protein [bacterium]HQO11157.1 GspE/PulE family protein [bacterium]HQQ38155.1 GspE/PulE family protein [bacterium]